jgi:hypothetical protein
MPVVPYTTKTGLQIGKYYKKPTYVEQDTDMLLIQSYLIYDPAMIRKHNLIRLSYSVFIIILLVYLLLVSKK